MIIIYNELKSFDKFIRTAWLDILATIPFNLIIFRFLKLVRIVKIFRVLSKVSKASKIINIHKVLKFFSKHSKFNHYLESRKK